MTRKTSTTDLPALGADNEISIRHAQTRQNGQGPQNGLTSGGGLAMSAIGMGLAVQLSASEEAQANIPQGQGGKLPQVDDVEKAVLALAGGLVAEAGDGTADLAAGSATAEHSTLSRAEEALAEQAPAAIEETGQPPADAVSFAPRLDADHKTERLDDPQTAENVTLPDRAPLPPVVGGMPPPVSNIPGAIVPELGGAVGGVVDSLLGEDGLVTEVVDTVLGGLLDPILGDNGIVSGVVGGIADGVLNPILGNDGVLGTVLNPILGQDGILQEVLDPILGADGIVQGVIDPILGKDGIVDGLLDPVQGVVGDLVGTVAGGLLDPVLGQDGALGGVVDTVLGQDGLVGSVLGPILGGDGLLSSALAPVVGEDGLVGSIVDTVLDPVLGSDGVLGTLLDPVLGDNGIANSVLDPLIGDEGVLNNVIGTVAGGVIEPILGEDGLAGAILSPLIGDDGALSYVLNPLIGEDGILNVALDPILGDDGLLPTLLDPILGQDGLLGGVLDPLVGAGGVLDTALTPILDATGPLGGLVDGLLGGLFGGWRNRGSAEPKGSTAQTQDAGTSEAGQAMVSPSAEEGNSADTGGVGDDGFLDSLIGAVAPGTEVIDFDSMASALSLPDDLVFSNLMDVDGLNDSAGALPPVEDLLGAMLGVGLSGQLVDEVGAFDAANMTPDLDLDTLLNGVIDSGDSAVEGITDPISELIAVDDTMGDLGQAVDGALSQILGDLGQLADLGSDLGAGLISWPDLSTDTDDGGTV